MQLRNSQWRRSIGQNLGFEGAELSFSTTPSQHIDICQPKSLQISFITQCLVLYSFQGQRVRWKFPSLQSSDCRNWPAQIQKWLRAPTVVNPYGINSSVVKGFINNIKCFYLSENSESFETVCVENPMDRGPGKLQFMGSQAQYNYRWLHFSSSVEAVLGIRRKYKIFNTMEP